MKRFIFLLFSVIFSISVASAKNWCEILIGNLNTKSGVDKTMAVNRDPDTHEITNATYSFRFDSKKLYQQIVNTIKGHTQESDYYSEMGGKYGTILLRFSDNGRVWSCKLMNDRVSKQFLVTVRSDGSNEDAIISSQDIENARIQVEESRRQIQQAREQAQRAKQEAQQAAQQAKREAQQAAQEAKRQAQQAAQQAIRAQEQARRQARSASNSSSSSSSTTTIINNTPEQTSEINSHAQALRDAEAKRKQKLGL